MKYILDVLVIREHIQTVTIEADSMEDAIKIAKQKSYTHADPKEIFENVRILKGAKVNNLSLEKYVLAEKSSLLSSNHYSKE